MNTIEAQVVPNSPLEKVRRFIISWRFPAFGMSLLFFTTLFIAGMVFVPQGTGSLAAYARDFKVWCFRYDPATGQMEWVFVVMFILQPVFLSMIMLAVWWRQLREVWQSHRAAFLPWVLGALGIVLLGAGLFQFFLRPTAQGSTLPFPAEQLRTEIPALDFTLWNQDGEQVQLSKLRGRTIMLTAVYARCGSACPLILQETGRVLQRLSPAEKEKLTVLAITLDPANDSIPALKMLSQMHGLTTPLVHFLTGPVPEVNRVLDHYDISRKKDPKTGVISHASIFILIDPSGKVAYRFAQGKNQEEWLVTALRMLLREAQS